MSDSSLQVLTVGLGALGTLYSFLLQRGGAEVTAVARSNYEVVQQHGIDIQSGKYGNEPSWRPTRLLKNAADASDRVYDVILFAAKCTPDVTLMSELLRPFLRKPNSALEGPLLVMVSNGIGIEEEPYTVLHKAEGLIAGIVSCCGWVSCNLVDGGKKILHSELDRLEMGLYPTPVPGHDSTAVQAKFDKLVAGFEAGKGTAVPVPDIQPARWRKNCWSVGWAGFATISRQTLVKITSPEVQSTTVPVVRATMQENVNVARALGYGEDVVPSTCIDDALNLTLGMFGREQPGRDDNFKPSLTLDLEAGRPMELLGIFESVIQRARQHNIPTPCLDLIFACLKPAQLAAIESRKVQ